MKLRRKREVRVHMRKSTGLVFFLVYAGSFLFSATSPKRPIWYRRLNKSKWTPPGHVIGVVWSILYLFIAASVAFVYERKSTHKKTTIFYTVFIFNYMFNLAFSFVFFRLRSRFFGMVVTMVVSLTSIWLIVLAKPISKLSAILLVPYALWSTFASYLAYKIYWLNR